MSSKRCLLGKTVLLANKLNFPNIFLVDNKFLRENKLPFFKERKEEEKMQAKSYGAGAGAGRDSFFLILHC